MLLNFASIYSVYRFTALSGLVGHALTFSSMLSVLQSMMRPGDIPIFCQSILPHSAHYSPPSLRVCLSAAPPHATFQSSSILANVISAVAVATSSACRPGQNTEQERGHSGAVSLHHSASSFISTKLIYTAPCGLRGCKNRPHSVSWPDVVKGIPNQDVDCFVS